ncbi:MAG: hypothetical protein FIB01_07255, partial [Gemmatimonadetes bacterium]|nr:hypothetical protein [Gemmatimonadota bacterium]
MRERSYLTAPGLLLLLSILDTSAVHAQGTPAGAGARLIDATRPGRDPAQAVDSAYTAKIREYTTEPFFLSPLVDYLPAAPAVPTPMAVLGDIAGSPNRLPYTAEVHDYLRRLAQASPRVRVFTIGTTEEGRELIAVAVASEELLGRLEDNRARLEQLADPRLIGLIDSVAAALVRLTVPVYYITGAIHSTEAGAPTALMELAYRLAVDESPYIRNIRDHLITLITPVTEPDGRDRMVDIARWKQARPDSVAPSLQYWGHYVAHDNNRDAMSVSLQLTKHVLDTFVGWKAQVLHDLHESVPYLYDNTIGDGPYNAWLDPLLTNEWQLIGWNNVQELTRLGMPGVFAFGTFDTWSPGYLMFIAATHNGISRLYETFGNGGTAETVERTLSPEQTARTWYRQNPPLPRVRWSLRNNNNYQQTGLLVSLSYFANNRELFLRNFYEKSKRSILKPRNEGPAAYVLPGDDPRPGAQAELLRVLQRQHVEIGRAPREFTVTLPAKRAGGGRGAGADSAGGTKGAKPDTTPTQRTFPAGSYVIRMDQPYSRIADALLDYQYWAPDDPQKNPYDDTGWTFPESFAVQAVRVTDPKVLEVAVVPVPGGARAPGGVSGNGNVFLLAANADNALATLRYRLPQAEIVAAAEPFEADGRKYPRGSFIVTGQDRAALDSSLVALGLRAWATGQVPAVAANRVRAARVAILHTWLGTQTEGWWRLAFDRLEIPYDYISTQDVAQIADLNARWDVILFPPAGGSGQAIIDGLPMWRNAMPWRQSPETPNIGTWAETADIRPGLGLEGLRHLKDFVSRGGVLVGAANTAEFAVQYGLTSGVSVNSPTSRVVGSLLRTRIVDALSPIAYGFPDSAAAYSEDGASFGVSNTRGGRG